VGSGSLYYRGTGSEEGRSFSRKKPNDKEIPQLSASRETGEKGGRGHTQVGKKKRPSWDKKMGEQEILNGRSGKSEGERRRKSGEGRETIRHDGMKGEATSKRGNFSA